MSSVLFNEAPSQSDEDSEGFEIGTINNTSTANDGTLQDQSQARSPFDISFSQVATKNQEAPQAAGNAERGRAGGGDRGQGGGTGGMTGKKGPLMKACWDLSQGGNREKAAHIPNQTFQNFMICEDKFSAGERIKVFGDQPAPFPFLVVTTPFNKVEVVHGIKRFCAPIGFENHYDHQVVAFKNDASIDSGIPKIITIYEDEFLDPKFYFVPSIVAIMKTDGSEETALPVPENEDSIKMSKLIPIPKFLVELFLNDGLPPNVIQAFQMFYERFFETASAELQEKTQYIADFLQTACGFDESQGEEEENTSQLAIQAEEIQPDPVMGQWALNHFGGIMQLAAYHDAMEKPAPTMTVQPESVINPERTLVTPATQQLRAKKTNDLRSARDLGVTFSQEASEKRRSSGAHTPVTSTGGQQAHQGNGGINPAAVIGANINVNTAAGVQQYAPNWGAQQLATVIGGNTLAAVTGVQNGVSGIGTPQVATVIGANSASTLMSAQQNQQMFGSNQAANANGAQAATVNGAQQMAQALGMGQGQLGFGL